MPRITPRSLGALALSGFAACAVALVPTTAAMSAPAPTAQPGLTAFTILSGQTLHHTYAVNGNGATATESLSKPDDITQFGAVVFVGFANGVGPQGEPSADGNTDSTIVAMSLFGKELAQWDIQGKCDGLTADAAIGGLIATVNEDANSSLYTITGGPHGTINVQHYSYNVPLPHDGGTDGISIAAGRILISASAPGTTGTPTTPPAVYSVTLDPATSIATVAPYFSDSETATVANTGAQEGHKVTLALTDPDSSEVVPAGSPRFSRDYMLDGQGDQQQVFVGHSANPSKSLSVLSLSQAVDDTAWAHGPGVLYATDSTNDAVDALGGTFPTDPIVAVTPCGSNSAPPTCPGPGFPANYLGTLNPWTGAITPLPVSGAAFVPQGGLLFTPFPKKR